MSWRYCVLISTWIALSTSTAAGQKPSNEQIAALQDRYRLWVERHVEACKASEASQAQKQNEDSPAGARLPNPWCKQREELERLYDDCVNTMGTRYPLTNQVDYALADLARHNGKLDEAEQRLQRILAWGRKVMGPEHPQTLTTSRSLATVQAERGKLRDSLALLQATLRIYERMLGHHPDAWMTRYDLAFVLCLAGKFEDAEAQFRKVLQSRSLKPESLRALRIQLNHALVLLRLGPVAETEKKHREILESIRGAHSDEIQQLQTALMHNIALTFQTHGRTAEAEVLYREVLEINRRVLGAEHPDTLGAMHALADSLPEKRVSEKRHLYDAWLEASHRVAGEHGFLTWAAKNNLAVFLSQRGRWKEAKKLLREVIEASAKKGDEHQQVTEACLRNLAIAHYSTGHYSEAESVLRELLKTGEARVDVRDRDNQDVRQMLREVQRRQGENLEESEGTAGAELLSRYAVFRAVYRAGPSCGDCLVRPNGPRVRQTWELVLD